MTGRTRRVLVGTVSAGALAAAAITAGPAGASAAHRTVGVVRGAHVHVDSSQSNNWSGYNKGVLETGTTFHSISGQWTVPTATQKVGGQAESSSSWIGIGGGCLETSCALTDSTLIQAGTEQDVATNGKATYSTWFEVIPAPSVSTPLAVKPGDVVSVSVAETVPEVWKIDVNNVTTGQTWSQTVPYPSTYATAEWIEETPLTFGTGGAGLSAMPNLGTVHFDLATVNGANAQLNPAEEMQLVSSSGSVVATPSAPDADTDGFDDCTFAGSCAASSS